MDLHSSSKSGHSAEVRITLLLNGRTIPVAQLGPGFLILNNPIDHPPADAGIVLRVDKSERRWALRLSTGISSDSKRVTIASA